MEKVYVGKIVSTHGIKGEIRILNQFNFKDKVFKIGNKLIIDDKEFLVPSSFFTKVDKKNKTIYVELVNGLE